MSKDALDSRTFNSTYAYNAYDDLTRIVGEEVMNKLHEIEQSIAQKTIPVPAGN